MHKERELLQRIADLQRPRHLFILPRWADPAALDSLIRGGYLSFSHLDRAKGAINLAMGLEITAKGSRLLRPSFSWPSLALKGSAAVVSLTTLSLIVLYLG